MLAICPYTQYFINILPVTKGLWSCLSNNAFVVSLRNDQGSEGGNTGVWQTSEGKQLKCVGCWPLYSQALHTYDAYFYRKADYMIF